MTVTLCYTVVYSGHEEIKTLFNKLLLQTADIPMLKAVEK